MEATMETETRSETPAMLPSEPPAPPKMFDLNGKGMLVPLAEVLAMADKDCRYCMGSGWQRFFANGQKDAPISERVCGCAIRLMRRKLAGETPSTSFVKVKKNADLERERVTKKIANLEAIVAKLEAEVVERIQGHDAGIAQAERNLASATEAVQAADDLRVAQLGTLGQLNERLAELLASIEVQKAYVEKAADGLCNSEAMRQAQETILNDLRTASDRILDSTAPTRHRIERLKAKIAAAKQQHPDVLGREA
jgi:DNA repair exonuclease SbcCD ATPase subunit